MQFEYSPIFRPNTKTNAVGKIYDSNHATFFPPIHKDVILAISVVKMKFKAVKRRSLRGRKVNTVYKTWRGTTSELRKLRKPRLELNESDLCCSQWIKSHSKKQKFLVMGRNKENSLVPTFIVPWSRDKVRLKTFEKLFPFIAFFRRIHINAYCIV